MSAEKKLSELFAEFATGLSYGDLPDRVVKQAKRATLDQLGCQLIGSTLEWNKIPYRLVKDFGGKPESTIVNYGTKAVAHDAAYVNGTFGQGAELDDVIEQGGGHAGAICVPVALALAEKNPVDGKEFLTAIVLGYQVAWGMGRLMYPGINSRGFHVQSVIGVFAAAAVAGKLIGLNTEEMVHAFGIAGSHASGTMEYDQCGGEVKRIHTGIAVRGGIQSAMLAKYGLTGPRSILEGSRGICPLFAGQCRTERLTEGLAKEWGIMYQAVKSYSCVFTLHSPIDVLSKLIAEHSLKPEQVERIEVYLSESALKHGAAIIEPQDVVGAQFSLAYSLAIRLLKGSNDLELYTDSRLWRDPQVLSLARKVEARADPEIHEEKRFASRVRVRLTDGRTVEGYEESPKGTPANPLTAKELVDKFQRLASQVLPMPQVREIIHRVEGLEQLQDVTQIIPLLVRN